MARTIPKKQQEQKQKQSDLLEPKSPETVTCQLTLPADLWHETLEYCRLQDIDINDFIRIALRGQRKTPVIHRLSTRLTFGKYKGETIEQVIRADPTYMIWALQATTRLTLDSSCRALLREFDPTLEFPNDANDDALTF